MNTKEICRPVLTGLLILLMAIPSGTFAQGSGTDATFRQEELDQMLAPIALYPDSLLAQILVAATYPLQVVQADRWIKQNKNLKGDQLNEALDKMNWDLSVKALAPFPQVLSMMSEKLDWTQKLGDAFLAQQADVMDTIQKLRARAKAQGNLQTTKEQQVTVQDQLIVIEPASPTVVYVPAYNPAVIYGPWWYPAYPPYPYYPAGAVVTAGVLGFAAGVAVGAAWNHGWGYWDWGHHDVNVNVNRNVNINRNINVSNIQTATWQHDVNQRAGVPYRDQATRQQYGQQGVGSADSRRDYRGYSQDAGDRAGQDFNRQGAAPLGDSRPSGTSGPGTAARPTADSTLQGLQQRESGGAFGNMGSGTEARMQGDRGRSSQDFSSGGYGGQGFGSTGRGGGGFDGGGADRGGFGGAGRGGGFGGGGGSRGGGGRR
jgi:hypothetical protein